MVSKKLNIDFKFNDYFPISSLNLMRGSLVMSEDISDKYIDCFFDAYWKDNINLSNDKNFKEKLKDLQINVGAPKIFLSKASCVSLINFSFVSFLPMLFKKLSTSI